jgi:Uma2 family endonuclease
MNWQDVCEHSGLQNLPFKIELNEQGKILMSPVKVYHSAYQGEIIRLMPTEGKVLAECAIKTRKGTKVADVAWASSERFEQIKREVECSIAPEVCVEVRSSSNTDNEIEEKKALYFESGAQEVWICNTNGDIHFYHFSGELKQSGLLAKFPNKISI